MIRRMVLACAFVLGGGAAVQLLAQTRYVLGASANVASILAPDVEDPSGVVFVFQPADCLDGGEMVRRWNDLYAQRRFRVTGRVASDGDLSGRQASLFRDVRVQMPLQRLSAREARIVAERLGYAETPFAVILDRNGRVAGSFPAGQNVPAQVVEGILRSR